MNRRINAVISTETFNDLQNKINEIRAALPFLVPLSAAEKRNAQNMGQSGVGFGKAAYKSSKTYRQAMTQDFEPEAYDNEIILNDQLEALLQNLLSLVSDMDDTRIANGQSIMSRARDVYAAIKYAARKETKYKSALEELRVFYKRTKMRKDLVPASVATINNVKNE
ncbi:MAG: hypothetical protein ACOYOA_09125 [Saprospiraceae bacterium]